MVLFKQLLKRFFGFRGNPEKEGKNESGEQSIYNCMDHWWFHMVVFPMCPVAVVQTTSKGLSTGSIVGIVVGAVAFVAILAAFATFLILHRHHKKQRRLSEWTQCLALGNKLVLHTRERIKFFCNLQLLFASHAIGPISILDHSNRETDQWCGSTEGIFFLSFL